MTLLDIGGGVGGIQHALLDQGAVSATHVDASSAYIQTAQEEADLRQIDDRITFLQGDYVDLAEDILVFHPVHLGLAVSGSHRFTDQLAPFSLVLIPL